MNKDKIHERFISLDYVINSNWDVVSKYVGKRCSLTVKCKKCGYTKNITARKESFNYSCPMCESFYGVVFGVNDLYTLRPDIANMMKDKDLSHKIGVYSNKKEWFICPLNAMILCLKFKHINI